MRAFRNADSRLSGYLVPVSCCQPGAARATRRVSHASFPCFRGQGRVRQSADFATALERALAMAAARSGRCASRTDDCAVLRPVFLGHGAPDGLGVSLQPRISDVHGQRLSAGRTLHGHGSVLHQQAAGAGQGRADVGISDLLGQASGQHGHAGHGADGAGDALGARRHGGVRHLVRYRHAQYGDLAADPAAARELGIPAELHRSGRDICCLGVCQHGGFTANHS
ncbi:hypothetical protein SDC9_161403 [bioreactor metagenome]|uniref:Uncharacterized protein n=1 Tax=bioreactor metagenome TaxID=1076179 RepID=A0A645FI87_9ZZZZ